MNWLKKGPELKLSELKVPDFLYDLYYDLKERHLLPLVALLIVAMVAAPIYFKGSTKSEPEATATPGTTATASSAAAGDETLVVARSEPGLRAYQRRLRRARALDPFEGPTEESTATAEATSAAASSPEASVPTETTVVGGESGSVAGAPAEITSPSESSGLPAESSSSDSGGKTRTRYVSDTIDVRIVTVPAHPTEQKRAKQSKPQAQVRRDLPELTMLPARKTPAATFMGLSSDGKKALFLVSSDVVSIFGEGRCVIGSQTCQLLALEPGLPETFIYGPQERTYRLELLKVDQTYAAKPRRATLGTKHHSNGGGGAGNGAGNEPTERGSSR
jgi:hypothetical protein